MSMHERDMYGNEIVPLGETGYGVSTTFASTGVDNLLHPFFTFFHISDGFRQSLFSVNLEKLANVHITNIFENRLAELRQLEPHGRRE